eukprot:gene11413-biopygen6364
MRCDAMRWCPPRHLREVHTEAAIATGVWLWRSGVHGERGALCRSERDYWLPPLKFAPGAAHEGARRKQGGWPGGGYLTCSGIYRCKLTRYASLFTQPWGSRVPAPSAVLLAPRQGPEFNVIFLTSHLVRSVLTSAQGGWVRKCTQHSPGTERIFFGDPFGIRLASVWEPFGILMGSVWDPFVILLESVWDPFWDPRAECIDFRARGQGLDSAPSAILSAPPPPPPPRGGDGAAPREAQRKWRDDAARVQSASRCCDICSRGPRPARVRVMLAYAKGGA